MTFERRACGRVFGRYNIIFLYRSDLIIFLSFLRFDANAHCNSRSHTAARVTDATVVKRLCRLGRRRLHRGRVRPSVRPRTGGSGLVPEEYYYVCDINNNITA